MLALLLAGCLGSDESGGDLPTLQGWTSYDCDSGSHNELPYDGPRPVMVWAKGGDGYWRDSTDFTAVFMPPDEQNDARIQVTAKAPCTIFVAE